MNTGPSGTDVTRRGATAGMVAEKPDRSAHPTHGESRVPTLRADIRETAFRNVNVPVGSRSETRPSVTPPPVIPQQVRQGQRQLPTLGPNNTTQGALQRLRTTNEVIPAGTDTAAVADILEKQSRGQVAQNYRVLIPEFRAALQLVHNRLAQYYTDHPGAPATKEVREFFIAFRAMNTAQVSNSTVFDEKTAQVLDKLWGIFGRQAPRDVSKNIVLDRSSMALVDFLQGNLAATAISLDTIKKDVDGGRAQDFSLAQIKTLASIILPYNTNERPLNQQTSRMLGYIESIRYTPTNLNDGQPYLDAMDRSLLLVASKKGASDPVDKLAKTAWRNAKSEYEARFDPIKDLDDEREDDPPARAQQWARFVISGGNGTATSSGLGSFTFDASIGVPPTVGFRALMPKPAEFADVPGYLKEVLENPGRSETCLNMTLLNFFSTFSWLKPGRSTDDGIRNGFDFNIYNRFKKWGLKESPYSGTKFASPFDDSPRRDNAHDVKVPKGTEIVAQGNGYILAAAMHIPEKSRDPKKGYGLNLVVFYPDADGKGGGTIVVHNHLKVLNQEIWEKLKQSNGAPVFVGAGDILAQTGNSGHVKSSRGGDGSHDHIIVYRVNAQGIAITTEAE